MAILLEEAPGRGLEALEEEECMSLLHDCTHGRIAIAVGGIPVVFPVNYRAVNGAIYFFTEAGTKLAAANSGAVVAFEIDHFDAEYHHGWSVLAVGRATEVHEPLVRQLAADLPLEPWAPGQRGHLVQIWPEFVSGRRITFNPVG